MDAKKQTILNQTLTLPFLWTIAQGKQPDDEKWEAVLLINEEEW